MKIVILDIETGGLNPNIHSLLTVYLEIIDFNPISLEAKTIDSFSTMLKPVKNSYIVTKEALKVNKIDVEELNIKGESIEVARNRLINLLSKYSPRYIDYTKIDMFSSVYGESPREGKIERLLVLGHNVAFDLAFVHNNLIPKELWEIYCSHRILDTSTIGRMLILSGKIKLDYDSSFDEFCKYFGIVNTQPHDASYDVKATKELFLKMLECIRGQHE